MNMIERVARAICEEEWGKGSWVLVSDFSRNKAMTHAHAAIDAMREPTDAMIDAAGYELVPCGDFIPAYRAAIDVALNEQVSG